MQVINMSKGQRIDLSKPDNTPLKKNSCGSELERACI